MFQSYLSEVGFCQNIKGIVHTPVVIKCGSVSSSLTQPCAATLEVVKETSDLQKFVTSGHLDL